MTGDRVWHVVLRASQGWLVSLPILALGMGCFWLQRDAGGVAGVALAIAAIACLVLALVGPSIGCAVSIGRRGAAAYLLASGKGLAVAVVALALASLLSAVPSLRPEEISIFGQDYAQAHAIAVALPTLLALACVVAAARKTGRPRRIARTGLAFAGGVGVVLWWWSAGAGYEAIRLTNADEIVLMVQTVALAALLLATVADASLCGENARAGR